MSLADRLSAEEFWAYSVAAYAQAQTDLLRAQDEAGLDVNLALFCAFLDRLGAALSEFDRQRLDRISEQYKRELIPLRDRRRRLKGTWGYDTAKAVELEKEKEEQAALVAAIHAWQPTTQGVELNTYLDALISLDGSLALSLKETLSIV